jgi:hypothetical protein
MVYACKRCGQLTKSILETNGSTAPGEQGPGICSECLDFMFGMGEEAGRPQNHSDEAPKA